MILYSQTKDICLNFSLMQEKLLKFSFVTKFFLDYLSKKYYLRVFNLIKIKDNFTLCVNVEATGHSYRCYSPFRYFDVVITHKETQCDNCFYYSIYTEQIINKKCFT